MLNVIWQKGIVKITVSSNFRMIILNFNAFAWSKSIEAKWYVALFVLKLMTIFRNHVLIYNLLIRVAPVEVIGKVKGDNGSWEPYLR